MKVRSINLHLTRLSLLAFCVFAFSLPVAGHAQAAPTGSTLPEEIEWTWAVRPPHPDAKLPSVLLLGDSISRNYFPEVQQRLSGAANVYLLATSASVGDKRISRQLADFIAMEGVRFNVVHFNNGMHGWAYSEAEYNQAFPAFLDSIRTLAPGASLVWAATTPVKVDDVHGATNDRVNARNAIALLYINAAHIPVDDQHALMKQHLDTYQDSVHFNESGSKIQGDQAAESIRKVMR